MKNWSHHSAHSFGSGFKVGEVAYLGVNYLNNHRNLIIKPDDPTPRDGPFLCLYQDRFFELELWTSLTSKGRDERLFLPRDWWERGNPRWFEKMQYLNDGQTVYCGRPIAFRDAAKRKDFLPRRERPLLSREGLKKVMDEVISRNPSRLIRNLLENT